MTSLLLPQAIERGISAAVATTSSGMLETKMATGSKAVVSSSRALEPTGCSAVVDQELEKANTMLRQMEQKERAIAEGRRLAEAKLVKIREAYVARKLKEKEEEEKRRMEEEKEEFAKEAAAAEERLLREALRAEGLEEEYLKETKISESEGSSGVQPGSDTKESPPSKEEKKEKEEVKVKIEGVAAGEKVGDMAQASEEGPGGKLEPIDIDFEIGAESDPETRVSK